ncbi:MAG: YHS domain-containing protein [Bacteroidota bacterium]
MKKIILALPFLIACGQQPKAPADASQTNTPAPAAYALANTVDPICEMTVDNTVEDTAHYNGKIYGFCGAHCKESFKEDPVKYVKE